MNFRERLAEDRRLVILRLLSESDGYTANEYLLQTAMKGFGHDVSHDRVRADLAWLHEQGLVDVTEPAGVKLAQLTARGDDVAHGRGQCPGVKRPVPGA